MLLKEAWISNYTPLKIMECNYSNMASSEINYACKMVPGGTIRLTLSWLYQDVFM